MSNEQNKVLSKGAFLKMGMNKVLNLSERGYTDGHTLQHKYSGTVWRAQTEGNCNLIVEE